MRAFRGRPGARGGADRSETLLPSAASTQVTHRPILVERALVGLGREVVDFRRKTYYDILYFPRQNQHQRHRLLPDPASAFKAAERCGMKVRVVKVFAASAVAPPLDSLDLSWCLARATKTRRSIVNAILKCNQNRV